MLDTYEFCSEALKKQLDGPREAARAAADRAAGLEKAAKARSYPLCWKKPTFDPNANLNADALMEWSDRQAAVWWWQASRNINLQFIFLPQVDAG